MQMNTQRLCHFKNGAETGNVFAVQGGIEAFAGEAGIADYLRYAARGLYRQAPWL